MKKNSVLGFAMLVLASATSSADEQVQPLQVGRYQIMDATFSSAPDAPAKQFKQLVILDTATGVLTRCDFAYQDGGKTKDKQAFWWANGSCGPFIYPQPFTVPKNQKK